MLRSGATHRASIWRATRYSGSQDVLFVAGATREATGVMSHTHVRALVNWRSVHMSRRGESQRRVRGTGPIRNTDLSRGLVVTSQSSVHDPSRPLLLTQRRLASGGSMGLAQQPQSGYDALFEAIQVANVDKVEMDDTKGDVLWDDAFDSAERDIFLSYDAQDDLVRILPSFPPVSPRAALATTGARTETAVEHEDSDPFTAPSHVSLSSAARPAHASVSSDVAATTASALRDPACEEDDPFSAPPDDDDSLFAPRAFASAPFDVASAPATASAHTATAGTCPATARTQPAFEDEDPFSAPPHAGNSSTAPAHASVATDAAYIPTAAQSIELETGTYDSSSLSSDEFERQVVVDVHGNPVRYLLEKTMAHDREWLTNARPPDGLSDVDLRQWRQERAELIGFRQAIDAFHDKFVAVLQPSAENKKASKLTGAELIGRKRSTRNLERHQWIQVISESLEEGLQPFIDGMPAKSTRVSAADKLAHDAAAERAAKCARKKEETEEKKAVGGQKATFTLLAFEVAPTPRDSALDVLREERSRSALAKAMYARVRQLPPKANKKQIEQAMKDPILSVPEGQLREGDTPPEPESLVDTVLEEIQKQLRTKCESFALLSIHAAVMSTLVAPHNATPATSLAIELGRYVQLQSIREELMMAMREEHAEKMEALAAAKADSATDGANEAEAYEQLEREQRQAKRSLASKIKAFESLSPRKLASMAARERAKAVATKEEEGMVGPNWTTIERLSVGMNLLHVLFEKAFFEPMNRTDAAFDVDAGGDAASTAAGADARVSIFDADERNWRTEHDPSLCRAFRLALGSAGAAAKGKKYVKHNFVQCHPELRTMFLGGTSPTELARSLIPEEQPMLSPPLAWQKMPGEMPSGGFLHHHASIIRCHSIRQIEAVKAAPPEQLAPLMDALNACASTAWKVNKPVLETLKKLWEQPGGTDILPMLWDPQIPPKLTDRVEKDVYFEHQLKTREALKFKAENNSLRATTSLKLGVAERFADETFYFPHNLDFRGRAYPISPHLSYMGDDVCRGMLLFAESRQLGPDGLRWLKIHLANKFGKDKLPLEERVKWAESVLEAGQVDAVAKEPLSPSSLSWWAKTAADPCQFYATCLELHAAYSLASPEDFMSSLPVHQDGSCNGLQHYAALGRDSRGGAQVNLVPADTPQDVYAGVCALVNQRVDAAADEGSELAQQLCGHITRKVVKQTVMTSVYGVTLLGAKEQILARLDEVEGLQQLPSLERNKMALYLAKLTLESLKSVYSGASESMDWLAFVAREVVRTTHQPVQWTMPMGLPVVQPYFKLSRKRIKTAISQVTLVCEDGTEPADRIKQRGAFPPNYVHSLDSSHMLLTAAECRRQEITFAAVHDSFWTHAGTVAQMNSILRDQFIELHREPQLQKLADELKDKYSCKYRDSACEHALAMDERHAKGENAADVIVSCPVEGCCRVSFENAKLKLPKLGDLDLNCVRNSVYFFA